MKKLLFTLLLLSISFAVRGDDAPLQMAPLPTGFSLSRLPAQAKWEILFSYPDDKTPNTKAAGTAGAADAGSPVMARPRLVTVTRTDPIWHAVMTDTAGATRDSWGDGLYVYLQPPGADSPVPVSTQTHVKYWSGSMLFLTCYNGADFVETDWISSATYVGKRGNAFVFRQAGDAGWEVSVDASTRLPVLWKQGQVTRTLRVLDTPAEMQELSPTVAKMSADLQHFHQASVAPPRPRDSLPPGSP
jgi:hypothetical protein